MSNSTILSASAPASDADVHQFRAVVVDMDAMAQSGFSKISSIARMALAALQGPPRPREDSDIINVLKAIWHIADDIENCINSRAEDVGANYIDEHSHRRPTATTAAPAQEGGVK
ncbi:hypothetical protein [Massilia sp. PWRC2]|uniref:hypothetical protein n=1 Tax=Massilia sp. PWRC2 TaxID=2804626 RepID=UPI003CF7F9EF